MTEERLAAASKLVSRIRWVRMALETADLGKAVEERVICIQLDHLEPVWFNAIHLAYVEGMEELLAKLEAEFAKA